MYTDWVRPRTLADVIGRCHSCRNDDVVVYRQLVATVRLFVIGGTGAVGRHAVRALTANRHTVTGTARSALTAEQLRLDGATPVKVSIFDRTALQRAFDGHDAVINLASAIPPITKFMSTKSWAANDRVRKEGSTAIVDAALAAGVERLIQESVSMIYPDRGDEWIDEDVPPDRYPLAEGNLAAEANTQRFRENGGHGVVLRFGWFYGPGATHSEQFFGFAKRGICVQMGYADTYVSSIHMVDAGSAVEAALNIPGGNYNIVDDEPLTKGDYATALATAAGTRCRLRYPGRAALLLGNRTTSLTRSLRVSNHRFRHTAGWTPTYVSARQGWLATAQILDNRNTR